MIRVTVIGAAGRMGRRLVANVLESGDLVLGGALEMADSPLLGQDAGSVAGVAACGVKISSDAAAAFAVSDAVINFSTSGVVGATRLAAANGCSCVIGTTALPVEDRVELENLAASGARIVFAPNMSIGVNLLFYLTRKAAEILGNDYDVEITEMHHNQKKDAPSGTAVRLAEILCDVKGWDYASDVRHGREGMVGSRSGREIGMHSLRGGDVVGDHTVMFAVQGERVELTHKASSRDTFAHGALRAVRFLASAPAGLYDMQDVLNLK